MCCPCCNKTNFLGCFDSCGLILDLEAQVQEGDAGIWTINLYFGRSVYEYESTLAEGDDITFELENINENFTYTAQVYKPDGTLYVDVDGNDCLKFTTQKTYVGNTN